MFDTTIVRTPSTVRVEETRTVTEHRAPTDESVRLLAEMEDAARKRIVAAYALRPNDLADAALVIFQDAVPFMHIIHIDFTLNGEHRHVVARVDAMTGLQSERKLLEAVVTEMSSAIVKDLLPLLVDRWTKVR